MPRTSHQKLIHKQRESTTRVGGKIEEEEKKKSPGDSQGEEKTGEAAGT